MKKFVAILLAILMAFTCSTAIAAGAKSPTVQGLYHWTPAYTWTEMNPAPTMESIEFAKETIEYFLGSDYTIYEAFDLNISFKYGIVRFVAPTIFPDGDYIFILTNEENTYFITPILIDGEDGSETAVMDFTNVELGIYHAYLVGNNMHDGV